MFVYFENLLHIVVVICGCRCLFLVVDVDEDAWIVWMVAVARNNTTSGKISPACSDFMCLTQQYHVLWRRVTSRCE